MFSSCEAWSAFTKAQYSNATIAKHPQSTQATHLRKTTTLPRVGRENVTLLTNPFHAGISAASRIKKSCLVLCTNSVSVDQWRHQFLLWSTADSRSVGRFTSGQKEPFMGASSVLITTYTMIAYSGRRSDESAKVRQGCCGPFSAGTACSHARW